MDKYVLETGSKTELASTDHPRSEFAIANCDNKAIFVTGGYIGETLTNTVLKFTLESSTFSYVSPMD